MSRILFGALASLALTIAVPTSNTIADEPYLMPSFPGYAAQKGPYYGPSPFPEPQYQPNFRPQYPTYQPSQVPFNAPRPQLRQGLMNVGMGVATTVLRNRMNQFPNGPSQWNAPPPTYGHQFGELLGQAIIGGPQYAGPRPIAPVPQYRTVPIPGTNQYYTVVVPGP